jgi:hypothetical protein
MGAVNSVISPGPVYYVSLNILIIIDHVVLIHNMVMIVLEY